MAKETIPGQVPSPLGMLTLTKHGMLRFIERLELQLPDKKKRKQSALWYYNDLALKLSNSVQVERRTNLEALLKYGEPSYYLRSGDWVFVVDKEKELRTCYLKSPHWDAYGKG